MTSDLSQHINIGKELERILVEAGITSFAELKNLGSEQAFLRLRAADPSACRNMIYALEGAIAGIRWHDLPAGRKAELKEFHQMLKDPK
jgi:DNA transformation protein